MALPIFSALRSQRGVPSGTWYFIAGVTYSALNRPEVVPSILKYALEKGVSSEERKVTDMQEQLLIARRLREALVKSTAIVGLPKTINSLMALKRSTPEELLDAPLEYTPSARSVELFDVAPSAILDRGQKFFDQVYGKVSKRVMGQMDRAAEDLGLTARLLYGYLLSNSNILTPAETSFILIAGLMPMDVNPQLKGHLRGALNNGASKEEVNSVQDLVMSICRDCNMDYLEPQSSNGWGWREEVARLK